MCVSKKMSRYFNFCNTSINSPEKIEWNKFLGRCFLFGNHNTYVFNSFFRSSAFYNSIWFAPSILALFFPFFLFAFCYGTPLLALFYLEIYCIQCFKHNKFPSHFYSFPFFAAISPADVCVRAVSCECGCESDAFFFSI